MNWPTGLKETAIRRAWFEKISRLPADQDLQKCVRLLREPYGAVRRWGVLFGYDFSDRRRTVSAEQWGKVDWKLRDAEIARELGVTRECVRLVRRARGIGPSAAQTATRQLSRFISSNREKLHGLLVEEVIHHSGTDLPYHVVRRILREQDVKPHEATSPLRDIDWRLPNRDLAGVWSTSPRYIANLRARLGVGPATWPARTGAATRSPAKYNSALAAERQKATASRRRRQRTGLRQTTMA
jgi:hypothetical protein